MNPEPVSVPSEARPRWSTRRVLLFLVPLYLYYVFPFGFWPIQPPGANEAAHVYLALALYQRGETCLDQEVDDYLFNHDLIYRDGHFYSNKAPGPAFWLVLAAPVVDLLTPGQIEFVTLLYVGRILLLSLPFVLFLFLLGRTLERLTAPVWAWGLTLAYGLGTSGSAYAVLYFGHDMAAMALGTSFILVAFHEPDARRWWALVSGLLAGLAAGFGVISEYQAVGIALVIALLVVLGLPRPLDRRRLVSYGLHLGGFAAGALVMAAILFLYNRSVTQSAIQVPYETEFKRFDIPTASTLGFSFPSPWKLLNLAFSPGVGLFFHSPWLLAIFPAAVVAFRARPGRRRLLLGALAAAVVMVLTIASHEYWVGGAIAGPRYIAASLPFLLFPIAGLIDRVKGRWRPALTTALIATSVLSIVVFFLILVVTPYINTSPENLGQNPLGSFVWPLLTAGRMMFTVANYCGAGVWLSFALFLLLLTLVLGGFALPGLGAVPAKTRWWLLGSGALGLVLVPLWAGIGSHATVETRRHLPRLMRLMDLGTQFRAHGEILFMLRPTAIRPRRFHHDVAMIDPSLESVLGRDPTLYEVATNFKLLQGAVWSPDGFLFLSDARKPVLYKYDPAAGVSINRRYHGYRSSDAGHLESPGSSGLAFDRSGRLTIAEYGGGRRVVRLEQDGRVTVLADRFEGKRLNSPSSLTYRSDGLLYFTDPPFGLGRAGGDAGRELDFNGVFRFAGGKLELMDRKVGAPAGIAFSPDERHLYVAEWSPRRKLLIQFDVDSEGNLSNGRAIAVFPGSGIKLPTQGLLVDRKGNLFVTVGSNIGIVSRHGKHLGVIRTEAPVMSLAWGDPDGKALYMTAGRLLLKMRVRTGGRRR